MGNESCWLSQGVSVSLSFAVLTWRIMRELIRRHRSKRLRVVDGEEDADHYSSFSKRARSPIFTV